VPKEIIEVCRPLGGSRRVCATYMRDEYGAAMEALDETCASAARPARRPPARQTNDLFGPGRRRHRTGVVCFQDAGRAIDGL